MKATEWEMRVCTDKTRKKRWGRGKTNSIELTKKINEFFKREKNNNNKKNTTLNAIHYYLFRHKFHCNECTLNEWPFPFYIKSTQFWHIQRKVPVYLNIVVVVNSMQFVSFVPFLVYVCVCVFTCCSATVNECAAIFSVHSIFGQNGNEGNKTKIKEKKNRTLIDFW